MKKTSKAGHLNSKIHCDSLKEYQQRLQTAHAQTAPIPQFVTFNSLPTSALAQENPRSTVPEKDLFGEIVMHNQNWTYHNSNGDPIILSAGSDPTTVIQNKQSQLYQQMDGLHLLHSHRLFNLDQNDNEEPNDLEESFVDMLQFRIDGLDSAHEDDGQSETMDVDTATSNSAAWLPHGSKTVSFPDLTFPGDMNVKTLDVYVRPSRQSAEVKTLG
ncbi:hypothetical protein VKT23_002716 [Stygiomarasmius scandens]|uniref:Uncharacterized protein n=1 Tax=Marasmiellus scandens TaxID=2682957 RepID=A0ABR1K434_9AGAR